MFALTPSLLENDHLTSGGMCFSSQADLKKKKNVLNVNHRYLIALNFENNNLIGRVEKLYKFERTLREKYFLTKKINHKPPP